MGRPEMHQIMRYVNSLAPEFFAANMRGASESDIARLQEAARTPIYDSYHEFLTWAGNTPAQALNPFLNDRDYCIETLLVEYERFNEYDDPLAPGVMLFSSSDITGEVIFIRQSPNRHDDPEIGYLAPSDPKDRRMAAREFRPAHEQRLESYVASFAFAFRLGQSEHELQFGSHWLEDEQRREGDPTDVWAVLEKQGFQPVFSLADGSVCAQTDTLAVELCKDGSGSIAGDDREELLLLREILSDHMPWPMRFGFMSETYRLRAPRR